VEPNDATADPELTFSDLRFAEPALASVLDELESEPTADDIDPTVIKLDRNHEYSLWISYAEVYNEKVYDLLAPSGSENTGTTKIPRTAAGGGPHSNSSHPLLLSRKALSIRPSPPSDAWDPDSPGGKYVAGLRHMRATSAAHAKGILKFGQLHRRVFGTLANSQSSRSHGVVTLKLLRQHRGERNVHLFSCQFLSCPR
jgi:kinesin family member 20